MVLLMHMKVYKIQNKTGLFSTGGSNPTFNKKGKIWTGIGPLKNHFACVLHHKPSASTYNPYEDCVVLEYVLENPKQISLESMFEI